MVTVKDLCSLLLTFQQLMVLEGFQWSLKQQASHVINVPLGADVSLPCEYELTPQERQEANVFHLLTWTREQPLNSNNWSGLAIKSSLTGTKVIHEDSEHVSLTNDTLYVNNVSMKDHTRYQCAFQSSFFTTPSTIQLDVQYKPTETQLSSESESVEEGKALEITCTARANPSAEYRIYRSDDLIGSFKTGVHTVKSVKSEDGGTYKCVPYNALGDGPEASITVTVEDSESKIPVWVFGAIGGGVLLIALIAFVALYCTRKKKLAKKAKTPAPERTSRGKDAVGSHVGPAIYGSYGDQMNGGHSIPHLNEAVSFSDLRASREIPELRATMSANDVRLDENNYVTIQDAHLARSVIHLVESGCETDSRL